MSDPDLIGLAEAERGDLVELLHSLTAEQWDAPSLCAGWSVRDVAVHVVSYDALSPLQLAGAFLRGGMRISTVNSVVLQRYAALDPAGVVDLVTRDVRPRGLTTGFGGNIALTDGTIHHQDIRRALGVPRDIPEVRLRSVLDFALRAVALPARKNAQHLRLVATDLDWQAGDGPEVTGPGEALLMAVAGRVQALDDLEGPGLPVLSGRLVAHTAG